LVNEERGAGEESDLSDAEIEDPRLMYRAKMQAEARPKLHLPPPSAFDQTPMGAPSAQSMAAMAYYNPEAGSATPMSTAAMGAVPSPSGKLSKKRAATEGAFVLLGVA